MWRRSGLARGRAGIQRAHRRPRRALPRLQPRPARCRRVHSTLRRGPMATPTSEIAASFRPPHDLRCRCWRSSARCCVRRLLKRCQRRRRTPMPHAPELPPRPRELRINGFDPCSALTSAQLQSLESGSTQPTSRPRQRGPGCDWIHSPDEPVESYTVDINTRGGVELAFEPAPASRSSRSLASAQSTTPGLYSSGEHDCIINVDVASGAGRAGRLLLQRLDRAHESRDRVPEGAQCRRVGDADDLGEGRRLRSFAKRPRTITARDIPSAHDRDRAPRRRLPEHTARAEARVVPECAGPFGCGARPRIHGRGGRALHRLGLRRARHLAQSRRRLDGRCGDQRRGHPPARRPLEP